MEEVGEANSERRAAGGEQQEAGGEIGSWQRWQHDQQQNATGWAITYVGAWVSHQIAHASSLHPHPPTHSLQLLRLCPRALVARQWGGQGEQAVDHEHPLVCWVQVAALIHAAGGKNQNMTSESVGGCRSEAWQD